MNVLMTGGSRFIGRRLCDRLIGEGHGVYVLSRTPAMAASHSVLGGVDMLTGDLGDADAVRAAVRRAKPEVVFHLASERPGDPNGTVSSMAWTNGDGTHTMLSACADFNRDVVVVYASGMGVYDYERPIRIQVDEDHAATGADAYGVSKLIGELWLWCHHFAVRRGVAAVILRVSGVYGPGKAKGIVYACLQSVANGDVVPLSDAGVRRDLVYVNDVVDALVRALGVARASRCPHYNIGAGLGVSLRDVVAVVERVTGGKVRTSPAGGGPSSEFYFDVARAARDLGYRPRSLEEGVREFWKAWPATPG